MDARHSEDVVVRVVGDHGNLESGERTGVAWRVAWVSVRGSTGSHKPAAKLPR